MTRHRSAAALAVIAALCAALVTTAGAGATAQAQHRAQAQLYTFAGSLLATPGANAQTLSVQVETGNRPALRALIGSSQNQVFSIGPKTEILVWSHGVPRIGSSSDLRAGDYVTLRIRATRGSSLQEIEQQPAALVADRRAAPSPSQPLWLFIGTVAGPQSGGKIALHVTSGNWKALQAMLGQPLDQTFLTSQDTIFLLWQGRVPTMIDASQLKAGAKITVRIRAPRAASLAQVAATVANRVGDHEPPVPTPE